MMEISYGHSVSSLDDEYIVLADNAISGATATGAAAASLIDFFPICKSMHLGILAFTRADAMLQYVMYRHGFQEQASGRKSMRFASLCV